MATYRVCEFIFFSLNYLWNNDDGTDGYMLCHRWFSGGGRVQVTQFTQFTQVIVWEAIANTETCRNSTQNSDHSVHTIEVSSHFFVCLFRVAFFCVSWVHAILFFLMYPIDGAMNIAKTTHQSTHVAGYSTNNTNSKSTLSDITLNTFETMWTRCSVYGAYKNTWHLSFIWFPVIPLRFYFHMRLYSYGTVVGSCFCPGSLSNFLYYYF